MIALQKKKKKSYLKIVNEISLKIDSVILKISFINFKLV